MNNGAPAPFGATPNRQQLAWQEMGMYAFLHFTVNTFTGREWGDGTEPEDCFNPSELDCGQWCRIIAEAGFKGAVLTAKHHDGFCLWPSKYTTHSVRYSKWRDGKGDVVGDFVRAAKQYGLKVGLYLSPWDRHEKTYGSGEAYNEFYANQLRELLTNYGGPGGRDIFITWFDGACGEGPNGKVQEYDFERSYAVIRECAPEAVIFGHMGEHRDLRWCGNERGFAGSPNWATIEEYRMALLQNGTPGGRYYWPSEVDVSIRPGWFYHRYDDVLVHSLEHLLDIWYHSVGRGSCLNLNLPPDTRGLIHEQDERRVRELKAVLDRTFREDFAAGAAVSASDERCGDFRAGNLTDGSGETYWATHDGVTQAEAVVELGAVRKLNVILLKEYSQLGERVSEFEVEYRTEDGGWRTLVKDTTISFRKILRTPTVETGALKLKITGALACPCIQEFGAYYQPPILFAPVIRRSPDGTVTLSCQTGSARIHYTLDGSQPTVHSPCYSAPVQVREAGMIRAISVFPDGMANEYPEITAAPESALRFGVAADEWRVLAADSEDSETPKESVIRSDDSFWRTAPEVPYPHFLTVDTGKRQMIRGFLLTPTDEPYWPIARYRILVGDSPESVDTVVREDSLDNTENNAGVQTIVLDRPVEARYFRFEALESAKGIPVAAVKRLELY